MSVDLKLVDELRSRANVSYQEAVDALEKNNNSIVDALVYLENQNKLKTEKVSSSKGFASWIKEIISKGNKIKLIVSKGEDVLIKIPLTVGIIITVFAPYVTFIGLVVALITKHNVKFKKDSGEETSINKVINDFTQNLK